MSGRVPPSSRAGKRTRASPAAAASADVRKASSLYTRFTGHDVDSVDRVSVKPLPKVAVCVGELDGLLYTTVRDGQVEKYIHKFRAADRPLLCVSPDGLQILVGGGRYRFTELGIVDASDVKHRNAR